LNLMVNGLEAVGLRGELSIAARSNASLMERDSKEFIRIDVADQLRSHTGAAL
jgi:hypothetical protein